MIDGGPPGVNSSGGRVTGHFTVPQRQQQPKAGDERSRDLRAAGRPRRSRPAAGSRFARSPSPTTAAPCSTTSRSTVHRGEVVGLLGPNGAGKTTCFYSVMGLVKPDSGRIFLDGQDITELPMYRRAILGLGYLPQETSIFRGMTVEENIMAVLEVTEPRSARARRGGSSSCSASSA